MKATGVDVSLTGQWTWKMEGSDWVRRSVYKATDPACLFSPLPAPTEEIQRSVLTSIPTYWMSSFQLPKNTSAQIDARRCDFFLRFSDSNCHLYPKAWDSICKPKSSSGLNFRRAHDLNKALVSKLGWTIALSADKPWANLLRSKYLRGRSLLNASAKTNSSPLWHGIIKPIPLLKLGHCHLISSGNSINIWNDPWIPSLQGFIPPYPPSPSDIQLVAELIILGTRLWNRDLLHALFDQQTASSIQQIHLSTSPTKDTAIWAKNSSVMARVKHEHDH
nr:putative mitochondrial protein [Quercus suber]